MATQAIQAPTTSPPDVPRKRKRQRTIISCTECHRRKQKCDRQFPCGNCTLRSANHLCQYERKPGGSRGYDDPHNSLPEGNGKQASFSSADITASFGYLASRNNTAVEVLEKLNLEEDTWGQDGTFDINLEAENQTYNKIIATIPPRPYTMLLVKVFFSECNWIYASIHEQTFYELLEEWYNSCTSLPPPQHSNRGPEESSRRRTLRQFPTLLLQVLGVALQMLPREQYKHMAQLNLGNENFGPLSAKYSSSACELANLLSSSMSSLVRVQQWLLRASWLKNEGRAVESWHALGQGIREAQELGMHLEIPKSYAGRTQKSSTLWQREMEKRVWLSLYSWDRFMGVVLGRPTLINDSHCTVTPPLDVDVPNDLSKPLPPSRGAMDPPTSITERILSYQLAHLIPEIDELQRKAAQSSSREPDFNEVDRIHAKVLIMAKNYPPAFALENRDTSYDDQIPYLRAKAATLKSYSNSLIIGLHRPYIFSRAESRVEVVKSTIAILESQKDLFEGTKDHHHTIYTLNFFTFDPAVLLAAVLITSPRYISPPLREQGLRYLREGVERMENLGHRVTLARKGAKVLRLLYKRSEAAIASAHSSMTPPTDNTFNTPMGAFLPSPSSSSTLGFSPGRQSDQAFSSPSAFQQQYTSSDSSGSPNTLPLGVDFRALNNIPPIGDVWAPPSVFGNKQPSPPPPSPPPPLSARQHQHGQQQKEQTDMLQPLDLLLSEELGMEDTMGVMAFGQPIDDNEFWHNILSIPLQ